MKYFLIALILVASQAEAQSYYGNQYKQQRTMYSRDMKTQNYGTTVIKPNGNIQGYDMRGNQWQKEKRNLKAVARNTPQHSTMCLCHSLILSEIHPTNGSLHATL